MKIYLKLFFSSEGASTLDIIKSARKAGFRPTVGYYDFVIDFQKPSEYEHIIERLHKMLKGTKTLYTVMTRDD